MWTKCLTYFVINCLCKSHMEWRYTNQIRGHESMRNIWLTQINSIGLRTFVSFVFTRWSSIDLNTSIDRGHLKLNKMQSSFHIFISVIYFHGEILLTPHLHYQHFPLPIFLTLLWKWISGRSGLWFIGPLLFKILINP
jgi:hypothetical protein